MAYLSYARYQTLGGSLDEVTFNRLSFKAAKAVDMVTANRLTAYAEPSPNTLPALEYCMLELLNYYSIEDSARALHATSGGKVASVSNDGYSVSYVTKSGGDINSTSKGALVDTEAVQIIRLYLQGYCAKNIYAGGASDVITN